MDKFESKVKPGGILIYDGYGIHNVIKREDISIYRVDAMDAATEMGNEKAFNMLILGGLLKVCPMVKLENVLLGLKKSLPERHHKLIPMNEEAIDETEVLSYAIGFQKVALALLKSTIKLELLVQKQIQTQSINMA